MEEIIMNVNFDLKELLLFFKKTSFKIAFLIGISVYKFWLLDTENKIINNLVTIILILSIIFLLDDIIGKIAAYINRKNAIKKRINELKKLSDPQVLILILHYFEFNKDKLEINSTSYFNMHEGEYQILQSKLIIFRASSTSYTINFPFTMQEWAYNELVRAVENDEISFKESKKQYIIKWYSRELTCGKDIKDNYNNYY